MLMLHLSPLNERNIPWRIEYIEFDPNSSLVNKPKVINIRPPIGEYPSPRFAVALDYDMGDSLIHNVIPYDNAAVELSLLINKHNEILFTTERSLALFKELEFSLLLKDQLKDKKTLCIKSLVKTASLLKDFYKKNDHLTNNLKKLAEAHLNKITYSFIEATVFLFKDLYLNLNALTNYFLRDSLLISNKDTNNQGNLKAFLAIREQEIYLLAPLAIKGNEIYFYNLKFDIEKDHEFVGSQILIDDNTWQITTAAVTTNKILNILAITPQEIKTNLEHLNSKLQDKETLVKMLDIALTKSPKNKAISAPRSDYNSLNVRTSMFLEHETYLSITKFNDEPITLKKLLPKVKGLYRQLILDYLAGINIELLEEPYRSSFIEAVKAREELNRKSFTTELNLTMQNQLDDRQQKVLKRLFSAIETMMA